MVEHLVRPAPWTHTDQRAPATPPEGTRRAGPAPSGGARSGRTVRPASRAPARAPILRAPGFGGGIGALALLCLSTTPSLLPRPWLLQALLSGVTMLTGYAAGCAGAGLVWRLCRRRPPRVPGWAWLVLAVTGTGVAVTLLHLAGGWQRELRGLTGMPPHPWHPVPILAVAVVVAAGLLLAARAVRRVTAALAGWCGRWLPRTVAVVAAATAVATTGYALGTATLLQAVDHLVAASGDTSADVEPPTSPYVSGGPGSLVPWESLGAHGRKFVAGAVPVPELTRSRRGGGGARPPVRVYVGAESAPDPAARAALAVRELERTGGFDREVLVVVATTGSGWVNPVVTQAVEYLYRGDTAAVATQYSHRPSWVSFLTDRGAAIREAVALLTAVGQRIAALPPARRPTVLVYGESLGAYAVERALRRLPDRVATVDAGLLVGPPLGPSGDGNAVDGDGKRRLRLVHLQHANDPVVRWSPRLLWQRPLWLSGHRVPDVSAGMRWYPAVTFWQVTVDLLTSTRVPAGHGHAYGREIVDAVAALVPPPGWTGADTRRLHQLVG